MEVRAREVRGEKEKTKMTKFLKVLLAVCLLLAALIGADVVAAPYPECNPGECPPNQSVTPAMSFTVTAPAPRDTGPPDCGQIGGGG